MSAPFRTLFRWAREALDALGDMIPDKAVVIFKRPPGAWEVRRLTAEDVGAAPELHTHPNATPVSAGFMSAADKAKLDGLEPERPAWREIAVGSQLLAASDGRERLTLQAGPNIALTPDSSNNRIIISATGGGGGGGGGGGYGSVIVGTETLVADSGEPLVISAASPLVVTGDAATDTIQFVVQMGDGSGLDADTLDGQHAAAFAPVGHSHPEYALVGHDHAGVYAPISHTHPDATPTTSGFMSSVDKQKLDGIQPGAQVNQNAYSHLKVGATTISASSPTDTFELEAGANVTLTPYAGQKKVVISASSTATSPAFARVRVGTDEVVASTPDDTLNVTGLGEAQASLDTSTKTLRVYVPARNAFSTVRVGSTNVSASAPNDVVSLVAGNNITLTPDETNKTITIESTASSSNAFGQIKVGSTTLVAQVASALVELIASGYITITANASNNTITFSVNAGNSSGQIPVSNGTVCTNLNADMVDGYHASSFFGNYWYRGSGGYYIYVQNTAPAGASVGDVWIDTSQTA